MGDTSAELGSPGLFPRREPACSLPVTSDALGETQSNGFFQGSYIFGEASCNLKVHRCLRKKRQFYCLNHRRQEARQPPCQPRLP